MPKNLREPKQKPTTRVAASIERHGQRKRFQRKERSRMWEPPHPPVGESHVERAKGSRICQTEDDAGLRYDRDQDPEGIVYELAGKK